MLSPAEADLARRDPAIPGLGVVLDPDAFADALRRAAPEADLRAARIGFLRYRPHAYMQVTYRLDVAGRDVEVAVRACRPEELGALVGDEEGTGVAGPLGAGRIVLQRCAALVTVFPNDPGLPVLRAVADPAERRRLLREVVPDRPDLWDAGLRCLRVAPGRRYVAELQGAGGSRALLKCYGPRGYERARRNAAVFESRAAFRVARLLGGSDGRRVLVFEWVAGRLLSDICTAPELDGRLVAGAGSALAALHGGPADGLVCLTREDEATELLDLSAELGMLCPGLARRADELARRLAALVAGAPAVHAPVHGDFSAKQALVAGRETAIVDFDSAYCGDPAVDLGSFVAANERYALRGLVPPSRVALLREALLEGYGRATDRGPPARIALYTARGLFRRARLPFRAHEPDWPDRIEALLERAEQVVQP